MRKVVFIIIFIWASKLVLPNNTKLIGIWQEKDSILASGWKAVYRFFPDGTFIYNCSQYESLNRILSIHGIYKIQNDTLFTQIKYTVETKGGFLTRPDEIGSSSWQLKSYTIDTIHYSNLEFESAELEFCKKSNKQCIKIDGNPYFFVDKNPLNYE